MLKLRETCYNHPPYFWGENIGKICQCGIRVIDSLSKMKGNPMNHRRFHRLLVLVVFASASLGCRLLSPGSAPTPEQPTLAARQDLDPATQPAPAAKDVDGIKVDYVYTTGMITALYHLYGSVLDNFVDVTLSNETAQSVSLIVESYIEGYSTRSLDTVEVPPGETVEIHQNPRLTQEAIDKLASEQPGNFRIRVTRAGDGAVLLDESSQIHMYSRRDRVGIAGFDHAEEFALLAAWVTPNDPKVEELLRTAANYTDSGQMLSGYGGIADDAEGRVWDRLEAIWQAEDQDYDLTYVSTMVSFGENTVQRMRLPAEVLDDKGGNCLELAVLYASAAEALRMEAAIIGIPGHAYVAIRKDQESARYYFIETTLIGSASFEDAVLLGQKEWGEAQPHLDAGDEGYDWITIPIAREKGITPIPWK